MGESGRVGVRCGHRESHSPQEGVTTTSPAGCLVHRTAHTNSQLVLVHTHHMLSATLALACLVLHDHIYCHLAQLWLQNLVFFAPAEWLRHAAVFPLSLIRNSCRSIRWSEFVTLISYLSSNLKTSVWQNIFSKCEPCVSNSMISLSNYIPRFFVELPGVMVLPPTYIGMPLGMCARFPRIPMNTHWIVLLFNERPLVWRYSLTLASVSSQFRTNF